MDGVGCDGLLARKDLTEAMAGWRGVSRAPWDADGSPLSPQELVGLIALAAQEVLFAPQQVPRLPLETPRLQRPGLARASGPHPPHPPPMVSTVA